MNETYQMLRHLTSPIVAITSSRGPEANGMIANSAARASLSPHKPRLSVYIHKFNYTHDMVFDSGRFVLHILGRDQVEMVYQLGFTSRHDGDKLAGIAFETGRLGVPILRDCHSYFECEVVNVMDTGGSTLFLGAVRGSGAGNQDDVMTSHHLRAVMPPDRLEHYQANLAAAQAHATRLADSMTPVVWRGLRG